MMQIQNIKQGKDKIQSKLFNAVYVLPLQKQTIQNYIQLQDKIKVISAQLNYLAKTNIEEIERVCKTNSKLHVLARLLRDHNPPANFKQASFSMIISAIINMFTLMMTSNKMIQFFNKLSIPFSIYRIVAHLRYNSGSNKQQFLKKKEIEHSFKFIWKMLNIKSKNFPRLYAFIVTNVLTQYTYDSVQQIDKKQQQGYTVNKQNERISDTIKAILSIGIDLIKNNIKLAAQTGILVTMYKMAIENNLSLSVTTQVIDIIVNHMKIKDSRDVILSNLDLCKVFSLFTNVDLRQQSNKLQKLHKSCIIIQILLSNSPTLFYFIHERLTLQNFIISLKSKNKIQKQKAIINQKIFKKLIDKILRYDQNKMLRSHNYFGRQSNYLNYSTLLILSFFLTSTDIFDIYMNSDPNGQLFAGLGKVSLMYFPIIFQKPKYNKQIIQAIKIPSVSQYQHLNKNFLNIISYYDECIIPYQFSKQQVLSFLLYIKQLEQYKQINQENRICLEGLIQQCKDQETKIQELLKKFYRQAMKICQILPWKPEYLKLTKFLSMSVDYLRNHRLLEIKQQCLNVVKKIFLQAKPYYYGYLYITVLDDVGKYFQDDEVVQNLILSHYKNHEYSFRISRILLHIDINQRFQKKKHDLINHSSYKEILRNICTGGCEELVLLVIQIMKVYCVDYDDKVKQVAQIIEKCVYSQSEEIACAAVQFWQQFDAKHHHSQTYIRHFKLGDIKESNLRKRIMFLMLNNEKGFQTLNNFNPNFIKEQIDLWLKQGHNNIRQFSTFLSRQSKKFITNKDPTFLDIGKMSQNRRKLIHLPWNIQINQKRYVTIATYKFQEQRIRLRVTAELLIDKKIQITFFDIGGLNISSNSLNMKKEEIIKNYQKNNRIKDTKQIKKFAIVKENITLFFKYQAGVLVLRKLIIDIPLARDVYRSLTYPLSFITLLTKTGKGLSSLREHKFIQKCISYCRIAWQKQQKQIKQTDIQMIKGSIQCLGSLFSSRKLQSQQKKQVYKTVVEVFQKTSNFEIKQVALWVLNIIVKDDELRKQWKNSKGWLLMQSKYCGWLCFPQFYNQSQFSDRPLNRFAHVYELLDKFNKQGCPLTNMYFQLNQKKQKPEQQKVEYKDELYKNPQILKRKVIQFFRRQQNKQHLFNAKLLDKVVTYLSTKTWQMLDLFTEYFLSEKFDIDLAYGSNMP